MVEYLAKRTGHRFVRINNHEHTDLQEYLGTYVTDPHGKLVFQEGVLVEAVRKVQERGSMTVSASRFPIILLGLLGSTRRT
jgi:MoxR-like ATPase